MTTIHDNSLSRLYVSLVQNRGNDPEFQIDSDTALRLLARVGDRRGESANLTLRKLQDPELSREDKIKLVSRGMTRGEKADLATIIDAREVPFSKEAKSLFEDVLDRSLRAPGDLTLIPDQSNGIAGKAKPGDKIEAINLSAAPRLRLHTDDTVEIATADATGTFSGTLTGDQQIQAGDVIRLRARHSDGSATDWLTLNAQGPGLGQDKRNAEVATFRIGLTAASSGKVNVTNINVGRQISEPGATMQFTNERTKEKTSVQLDSEGTFPAGFQVNGNPGDKFSLAVTDGVNNRDFAESLPGLQLEVSGSGSGNGGVTDLVPDPNPMKEQQNPDGTSRFGKRRFDGPLATGDFKLTDPQQGQIGDCYLPSAIAALGLNHADAVKNMVKPNADGSFTVTFKERDWRNNGYRDVPVRVDSDLYVRSFGGPIYGASTGDHSQASMKLLFPLIEKAYAQWKGGYEEIGNGGLSNDVFEAVLGRAGSYVPITDGAEDLAWKSITRALDRKLPVSAGTYGEDEEWRYANTGVYSDHSYSVIGYDPSTRKVKLRNPWGESEPAGNGPNDGIFEIDMKTFTKLFSSVMSVRES